MKKKFLVEVDFQNAAPGHFDVAWATLLKMFCQRFEGHTLTIGTTRARVVSAKLFIEMPFLAP